LLNISIVTVSWNVKDFLAGCLDSLYTANIRLINEHGDVVTNEGSGFPGVEMIIVDSASSDETVSMINTSYPWVRLCSCSENVGFVRGNNIGLAMTRGETVMLLNPDTKVFPDTLTRLLEVLESDERYGIVGPHTLNGDGTHQSTRRRFPDVWTGLFESTWLEPMAPRSMMDRFRVTDKSDDGVYAVDWMQGSALLARRAVYEQIGGLDDRYVMFAEEMDWCKRACEAGWLNVYVGDAKMIHYGGQSTAQVSARAHVHFQHSKLRYFRKFHGIWAAILLRGVLTLNYVFQIFLETGKWLVGHKRPLRAQRVADYWIVVQSLLWAGEHLVMVEDS
jgi:N-acetylglucosaminyl-diphospho-decaprenol L-rhamnosyltransferase